MGSQPSCCRSCWDDDAKGDGTPHSPLSLSHRDQLKSNSDPKSGLEVAVYLNDHHTDDDTKSMSDEEIPFPKNTNTKLQISQLDETKSYDLSMSGNSRQRTPDISYSKDDIPFQSSADAGVSYYFASFKAEEDKAKTKFEITYVEDGVPISLRQETQYCADPDAVESTKFSLDYHWKDRPSMHWALWTRDKKAKKGYFKILNGQQIKKFNFNIFLYFVHHPKIKKYLNIQANDVWDQHDINIYIDGQHYTLQFFNGKIVSQCQAFSILQHRKKESEEESKENNSESKPLSKKQPIAIKALFFREAYEAIEWKWYNTDVSKYENYSNDREQRLEFEASYYANIQSNFPISNKLFRSAQNTSIFDYCYLPKFSKSRGKSRHYCLLFTLFSISEDDDFELTMDQVCLQGGLQRTVKREINRQIYLKTSLKRNIGKFNILSRTRVNSDVVAWIAVFDKNDQSHLRITSEFDKNKTSRFPFKNYTTSDGTFNHTSVNIKEYELITQKCDSYKWARFKRAGSRYCRPVTGYWAMSFNDDGKNEQLRQHLDAILSALQKSKIQNHFGINTDTNTFTNIEKPLTVTIDFQKYEILWCNTMPLNKAQAHAICIRKVDENKEIRPMYIMYFERDEMKFQWYDNDERQYKDYIEDTELMQLECSYLSNLDENFPNDIVKRIESDRKDRTRFFSHVTFSEFNKNKKIKMSKKLYVIRHQIVDEEAGDLILEQVAYTNSSHFPRTIRRIHPRELQDEKAMEFVPVVEEKEIERKPTVVTQKSIAFLGAHPVANRLSRIVERLTSIMVQYQEWIQSDDKSEGMLQKNLVFFYDVHHAPKTAITKLTEDFTAFKALIENKGDPYAENEFTKVSNDINSQLTQFGHESKDCICVQRNLRARKDDNSYFGFMDNAEIIAQQLLDSYHCELVHLYDDNYAMSPSDNDHFKSMSSIDVSDIKIDISDTDDIPPNTPQLNKYPSRVTQSSLMQYHEDQTKKYDKFNTGVYDTGIRFYYWEYFKYNTGNVEDISYRDKIEEPGNRKPNGKYYKLRHWYVAAAAKDFKEEILTFADNFRQKGSEKKSIHISIGQYDVAYEKARLYTESKQCRQMKADQSNTNSRYGIKEGSLIQLHHILAIMLYCSFTEVCYVFCGTFRRQTPSESDKSVKKRHSKCAIWARYLREAVEVFGLKLKKNGSKVPQTYYRGIGKKFLFEKTILRFNGPLSTTTDADIANHFAAMSINKDGMVMTLSPHWGDYPGNIRAFKCDMFSDRTWEREYLFIGGLEPLVIHNIVEVKTETSYVTKIEAVNNIHQIFEGMACKFQMQQTLIKEFINNQLYAKHDKKDDYMSCIFDKYCNDLKQIEIRLSLMKKSYKYIKDIFMDKHNNKLKLSKMIKLFPNCEKMIVYDGYDYQMFPVNSDKVDDTIFGSVLSIFAVKSKDHALKMIVLDALNAVKDAILSECQIKLKKFGWRCELNKTQDNDDKITYQYQILPINIGTK